MIDAASNKINRAECNAKGFLFAGDDYITERIQQEAKEIEKDWSGCDIYYLQRGKSINQ